MRYTKAEDFSKLPGKFHHLYKVLIIIDRGANISIVVIELLDGDNAVLLLCVPHAHEFDKDLLWGFVTVDDFWVRFDVVKLSNVLQLNGTISVDI